MRTLIRGLGVLAGGSCPYIAPLCSRVVSTAVRKYYLLDKLKREICHLLQLPCTFPSSSLYMMLEHWQPQLTMAEGALPIPLPLPCGVASNPTSRNAKPRNKQVLAMQFIVECDEDPAFTLFISAFSWECLDTYDMLYSVLLGGSPISEHLLFCQAQSSPSFSFG